MIPRSPAARAGLLAAAVLAASGCGDDLPGGAAADAGVRAHFSPLDSDGHDLRDAAGRIALLRGVNARVAGVFDVTFDDGRTPLEPIPALTDADCAEMRRLGFDLLRLPINWSGIEPSPGDYDEGYLDAVDSAVRCADRAGLLVLIDLHQDAYSKEIGEDGAPLWAIQPPPTMLLGGPLDDLDQRRQSRQVLDAFDSLFAPGDPHGLQAAYLAMLDRVAARFAAAPAVVGFEIINEPIAPSDTLDPFQFAAAARLRQAAPTKLVFFEPPAVRNFLDAQPLASAPFPVAGAVYAPHAYTYVFGDQSASLAGMTEDDLAFGIDHARAEADAWGVPLYIGEFGIGPDQTRAADWMRFQADLHDRYQASDSYWLWKERSQGRWGLFDYDDASETWTERPEVVGWVSRLHAARIAAARARVRSGPGRLELQVTEGPIDAPHEIYLPEAAVAAVTITCDGAPLPPPPRDPGTGLIEVRCSGDLVVSE